MQYLCPKCRAGGEDNDTLFRTPGHWCTVCPDYTVRMKPSHNKIILTKAEVLKHNTIVELNGE